MHDLPSDRGAFIEAIQLRMREMMKAHGREPVAKPWLGLELTMTQLKVLFALEASGPLRPSAIAAAIGVSATSATGVFDRLIDQGYVERRADATDRRAQLIQLTPSGAQLMSDLQAANQVRVAGLLNDLSDDDLHALYRGVTALVNAANVREDRIA